MGKLSPSLMCADFTALGNDLRAMERAGCEYLHFDIMDGHFVPNFTMGPDLMRSVRKFTNIPFDIHLMIERPEDWVTHFQPQVGDLVCVHAETTNHLQRTLSRIRDTGATPAVALNPATPLCNIEDVLCDVGMVLIMTVNPGFAGQKLVPATLDKVARLRKIIDEKYPNIEIQVDGNVSFENAVLMAKAGADIYVAGSSSVFNPNYSIEEGCTKLREYIAQGESQRV